MRKILLTGVVGGLLAALLIGSVKERDLDVKEPHPLSGPICGAAFGLRRSEAHSKHPHGNDDERAERDDGEGEEGV